MGRRLRQIRENPPRHGYETAYGHMTAFARNIQPAPRSARVKSSASSLDRRLDRAARALRNHVERQLRRPLKIKLPPPRARRSILAVFGEERQRLDGVMARKPARAAVAPGQSGA